MIQPKVSVIVPCWGVEKYLDRCVESLVHQTLQDIEIILVDDESPDRVPEMCDEWAKKDNRIKVVHKKNGGLGFACNSGLEIAKGEYVAFCDSDDWMEFNAYERLYTTAIQNNADAVYSGIQTINDSGVVRAMNQPERYEIMTNHNRILSFAMDMICSRAEDPVENHIAVSAKIVLYRRDLIETHHLRFESERKYVTEDLIFNLDVLGHASIVVTLPETFYYYYNNPKSISKKIRLDRFPFYKSNREEISRRTYEMGFNKNVNERIDRMFISFVRHQIGEILLSSHKLKDKKRVIDGMLKDPVTQDILSKYPVEKLKKQQRIIIWLMRHNFQLCLGLLFIVKRKIICQGF